MIVYIYTDIYHNKKTYKRHINLTKYVYDLYEEDYKTDKRN